MNYRRFTKKTELNRFFVRAFICLQRAFQNPSVLVFETLSEKPRRTKNLKTKIAILVYTF